jgi:TolB protein
VSDRAGQPAIYVMRDDGSEVRRVSTGTLDVDGPVWLPDGEHIGYVVTKENRDLEIQVMDLATGEATVLVVGWSPSWSPDGSRMAFTGGQMPQIVIADHDGGNARPVFQIDVNNMSFDMVPLWSPDGTQILFTGIVMDPENPQMNHEVFLTDAAGEERLRLTDQPGADQANDWSPDGREIVFMSERDGNPELYVLAIADGAIRRLTNHPGIDRSASWESIPAGRQ